ncbi:MAG: outer membrane protein [Oceanicoccus sp.]|jgi:outer membrane protein
MNKSTSLIIISTLLLMALPLISHSHEQGDWIVRTGVAVVETDESSRPISVGAISDLPGSGARVTNNTQFGITATYMLTDKPGMKLLVSTPFEYDVIVKSNALTGFGTIFPRHK